MADQYVSNINGYLIKDKEAHERLDALEENSGSDSNQVTIELDSTSTVSKVIQAMNLYQAYSANILWKEGNERCGLAGMLFSPYTIYFLKASTNQIVKVDFSSGTSLAISYINLASNAIQAVLTATEMDAILANATGDNVGSFYMYLGETTASYKKGSVYQVEEV